MKKTLLFLVIILLGNIPLKAQKNLLLPAVKKGGALSHLDAWYNSGHFLRGMERSCVSVSHKTAEKISKISASNILQSELERKAIFAFPTEEKFLIMGLRLPEIGQREAAFNDYHNVFERFAQIRKVVETQLIYSGNGQPFGLMAIPDRTKLIGDIFLLGTRVERLLAVYFPGDVGLRAVRDYLNDVMKSLNPYHQTFARNPRSDARKYRKNEFFLERPTDPRNSLKKVAYTNTLPENIRLAVLNDDTGILWTYRVWKKRGYFPKGWEISLYEETRTLLDDVNNGEEFDLIITDKIVYGGGGDYLVDQLRRKRVNATIIGNSNFLAEHMDGKEMFALGYDAYFTVGHIFDDIDGYSDWYYQLQTYYHFKELHNWSR